MLFPLRQFLASKKLFKSKRRHILLTKVMMMIHSDRGVQYACGDYTRLLRDHQIQISMSRKGNPYDNAKAESFMKTLKHEEVYRVEYRDLAQVRRGIGTFLEKTYNRKRLHSALGYLSPVAFELKQNQARTHAIT